MKKYVCFTGDGPTVEMWRGEENEKIESPAWYWTQGFAEGQIVGQKTTRYRIRQLPWWKRLLGRF